MPTNSCEHQLLFLICFLLSCQSSTSDAGEIPDLRGGGPFHDPTWNTSRSGGRQFSCTGASEQGPVGCRELRSMKYISDGQCTSLTPVKELVCAGDCLPISMLPNRIGSVGGRPWGWRQGPERRCVTDRVRNQRVRLRCRDGSDRTYRITAVTSCKCASGLTRDRAQN